jgi:hypothetical protein
MRAPASVFRNKPTRSSGKKAVRTFLIQTDRSLPNPVRLSPTLFARFLNRVNMHHPAENYWIEGPAGLGALSGCRRSSRRGVADNQKVSFLRAAQVGSILLILLAGIRHDLGVLARDGQRDGPGLRVKLRILESNSPLDVVIVGLLESFNEM